MNRPKHIIYRSRGCRTCRTRKVKCDQTRPICLKCTKARIQCLGYAEPTTFLIETPQVQRITSPPRTVLHQPSAEAIEASWSLAEPRSLPYSPESKQIAFLVKNLSIGTPGDGKGFSWLRHGLAMTDETHILYSSSRCLAEIFYGQHFRQQSTAASGMAKYGMVLHSLLQQMGGAVGERKNDLIVVIMTCMVTESIVPPSTGSFQFVRGMHMHAAGLSQLIREGGPVSLKRWGDLMVFEFCRCFIVGSAIVNKRHTFLAETKWKTVPWKYLGKSSSVELWDLLCDLPCLLSDLERRQVTSITWPKLEFTAAAGSAEDLCVRLTGLLRSLFIWRWNWERQYSGNVQNISVDSSETLMPSNSQNSRQVTLITFTDRFRAREIIYYNATLILLLRLGRGLVGEVLCNVNPAAPPDLPQPLQPSPLLLPPNIHSVEDATSEFYRSVEGHTYSRGVAASDSILLAFALTLAALGTVQGSRDAFLIRELRKKIIGKSGFSLWPSSQEKD